MRTGLSLALTRPSRNFSLSELFGTSTAGAYYEISPSTTFTDTTRTTPATVGQAVAAVTDQSGRGNHLTQATVASRPILRQDSGGKYYLEFDGVDDFMSAASVGAPTTAWTAFAVAQHTGSAFANLWSNRSTSTDGLRLDVNTNSTTAINVGNGTSLVSAFLAATILAKSVIGGKYASNAATAYHNNAASAPVAVTLSGGVANWALGKAQEFSGNYFKGRVYTLLSIHRVLSDNEMTLARDVIRNGAGVTF